MIPPRFVVRRFIYPQQKSLRKIVHPVTDQKLTVFRRTTADDKAMRTSTGRFYYLLCLSHTRGTRH